MKNHYFHTLIFSDKKCRARQLSPDILGNEFRNKQKNQKNKGKKRKSKTIFDWMRLLFNLTDFLYLNFYTLIPYMARRTNCAISTQILHKQFCDIFQQKISSWIDWCQTCTFWNEQIFETKHISFNTPRTNQSHFNAATGKFKFDEPDSLRSIDYIAFE